MEHSADYAGVTDWRQRDHLARKPWMKPEDCGCRMGPDGPYYVCRTPDCTSHAKACGGYCPPCFQRRMDEAAERAVIRGSIEELAGVIEWMDAHLDRDVAEQYKDQPLAQDWARCAKVTEEAGEVIDALIGITGQNPRKGTYGSEADLHDELCDVALTALYGLQHFTKDSGRTVALLLDRARYHRSRVEPHQRNGSSGDV